MSHYEESPRCKIHLMEGGQPKVKVLILNHNGIERSIVVNQNTFLTGLALSVETWLVNEHGVWNGTPNEIELPFSFLKAGVHYPFTCPMWVTPLHSEDRKAQDSLSAY